MAKKNAAPAEPSAPEVPQDATQDTQDTPAIVVDAAAALYRDKSGTNRAQQVTEGAANFGAITAAARSVLDNGQPDEAA